MKVTKYSQIFNKVRPKIHQILLNHFIVSLQISPTEQIRQLIRMCGPHLFDLWLFLDPEVAGVRELVVVDWMGRSVETDASVDVVHEIRISEDETDTENLYFSK